MADKVQISSKEQTVAFLAAHGRTATEIADIIGLPASTVTALLNTEKMQFEVKRIRYRLFGVDAKKRFQDLLPSAIETAESVMKDPNAKPATKLNAAQDIMDRALGKPTQTVQLEGSLVKALYERMDGKDAKPVVIETTAISDYSELELPNPNEKQPIDVKDNPNLAPEDPADSWVKNL